MIKRDEYSCRFLDVVLGPGGPVGAGPAVLNLPGVVGCGMAW